MSEDKKLRFGVIGFGLFGEGAILPSFKACQYAEIVAISKSNLDSAIAKAKQHGIPKAYASAGDLLLDSDIDAVYIASPNNRHLEDCIASLKAGKHILVEKPLAMNEEECRLIERARCEESKRQGRSLRVMVGHCLRFNPVVQRFKQAVQQGTFGKLVSVNATFFSQGRASKRTWKYNRSVAGGGAAFDLGVHVIDLTRFIAGSPDIISGCCVAVPSDEQDPVDDVSSFLLNFSNGVVAQCTSAFKGPRVTSLEVVLENAVLRAFDFHVGPGAPIRVETVVTDGPNATKVTQEMVTNDNVIGVQLDYFAECVWEQREPSPGPSEAAQTQRVIDLVHAQQHRSQNSPMSCFGAYQPTTARSSEGNNVIVYDHGRKQSPSSSSSRGQLITSFVLGSAFALALAASVVGFRRKETI